jgi:hypothetical protein
VAEIPRIRLVTPSEIRTPSELSDDAQSEGLVHGALNGKPTDEEVITTLVANQGIPARAAAMLNVSIEYVLKVAAKNARMFSTMARARVMIGSFATLMKLDEAIQGDVDNMPSDVLGRTYVGAFQAFTNLAGQFEDEQADEDTDDATAAKDDILTRLGNMGKREEAARAMQEDATEAAG